MNFRISALLLATAGTLALSGCEQPNPNAYPNDPNARAKNGAIAGAIAGAGAGLIFGKGDRAAQAVAGAALGAAVGGAVGHSLDQQAADLRRQIGDGRISVTNTGNTLVVNMPQDILFATDSDHVRPALRNELSGVAQNLSSYPDSTVQVVGHTDNTGTASYNQNLSERRAGAVAGILIGDGVAPQRIQAIGRGEDQPIATNQTSEGRARNRRVEIIIIPNR
ncbi:OmpA family protein [Acidimangrovimonas sediminis]|uniref:OmpA family protein n=1 Tax=Acidimangrovimonas sediminis TaxID=2056283 RepID=UPI000C80F345|nr:OmpA family protein [Acidimangrovimonas sediminis]